MVVFKPFMGVNSDNKPSTITDEALNPQGDLLERIRSMPQKKPVSLRDGWLIMQEEFLHLFFEMGDFDAVNPKLELHWVEWLSELGYHIVLTGDEYEEVAVA